MPFQKRDWANAVLDQMRFRMHSALFLFSFYLLRCPGCRLSFWVTIHWMQFSRWFQPSVPLDFLPESQALRFICFSKPSYVRTNFLTHNPFPSGSLSGPHYLTDDKWHQAHAEHDQPALTGRILGFEQMGQARQVNRRRYQ